MTFPHGHTTKLLCPVYFHSSESEYAHTHTLRKTKTKIDPTYNIGQLIRQYMQVHQDNLLGLDNDFKCIGGVRARMCVRVCICG